jgi:hypothetical protein
MTYDPTLYDKAYRSGARNAIDKDDFNAGRRQGVQDARHQARKYVMGEGTCIWLHELLGDHNCKLIDIKE